MKPQQFIADCLIHRKLRASVLAWLCLIIGIAPSWTTSGEIESTTIGPAFPREIVTFSPFDGNPIFTPSANQWDAKIRERGWIMHDGERWQMWYTGYDGTPEGKRMLGHATSSDGLKWTRDAHNPIYSDHTIEDMMVVRHQGAWYMFAEEGDLKSQWLTSTDGVNWIRQGELDIHLKNGQPIPPGPFGTPTVWVENDSWYLMYERGDRAIYLAASKDAQTWTNVQDEPVIEPGPNEYDKLLVAVNQVIQYQGRYYALYHGSGTPLRPRTWTTNIATSTDRIHWTKYAGNPLVAGDRSSGILVPVDPPEHNPQHTANGKSQAQFNDNRSTSFRLYTMHDKVEVFLPAAKQK